MVTQYVSAQDARLAAERTARASYGRLVALLAASSGDLALAEDALSDAFEQALATWPSGGVPRNPEAWLLTVARNRQRDTWKSAYHRTFAPLDAGTGQASLRGELLEDGVEGGVADGELDVDAIGDKRLELLFVCAHPAIDPAIRTPLMLQTVLGFDAARIGTAFAVPAAAMAQRLVRAKKKIKEARIPFSIPGRQDMPGRLPAVLEAVYGCYSIAWQDGDWQDAHPEESGMAGEAQYLAVTLAQLMGSEPEAWGLAALITLSLARSSGRNNDGRNADGLHGSYVPLEDQDFTLWDTHLIAQGELFLRRAVPAGAPGRFQLEAAIHAVHCDRARTGLTDWAALHTLYSALVSVAPGLGARVALAAVVGRVQGPAAGLAALENVGGGQPQAVRAAVERFQPYHAARAELLSRAGRTAEAAAAFTAAAALAQQPGMRGHLLRRAATAQADTQPATRRDGH